MEGIVKSIVAEVSVKVLRKLSKCPLFKVRKLPPQSRRLRLCFMELTDKNKHDFNIVYSLSEGNRKFGSSRNQ